MYAILVTLNEFNLDGILSVDCFFVGQNKQVLCFKKQEQAQHYIDFHMSNKENCEVVPYENKENILVFIDNYEEF